MIKCVRYANYEDRILSVRVDRSPFISYFDLLAGKSFEYSIFFFVYSIISNGIMFVLEYANFGGCMHSRSLRSRGMIDDKRRL